jgi:N-acetylneuraminate synthase
MDIINKIDDSVYIIAEIGNNHNGDIDKAIQLVDIAKEVGVDCVKFQLRSLNTLYRKKTLELIDADLGTEYIIDLLKRYELTVDEHLRIFNYVNDVGLDYMCTPWDTDSINLLEEFGVKQYKIASADFTNITLIKKVMKTGKPIFLSCGMSNSDEIERVTNEISNFGNLKILMHCNSTYPAPFEDLNLRYIQTLQMFHGFRIGYSGHERGIAASIAAVALGARVIERHITLDKDMEGPDHSASLLEQEFSSLVKGIREVEKSLGSSKERHISQGELINRENLSKSIIARRPIKIGQIITNADLSIKSPGIGLSPLYYDELVSKKAIRNLKADDYFYKSDLNSNISKIENQTKFKRSTGIPIRFHDIDQMIGNFKETINHVEFHLSFKDLEKGIPKNMNKFEDLGFVVHAPELFKNSMLLDLCSHNEFIRRTSVDNMISTINITKSLKKYFPNEVRPRIVTNIGGFSRDNALEPDQIEILLKQLARSLKEIEDEEVEIIPQTMAPFPWHFGGQRFHNLMMSALDIENLVKTFNFNICLDVSHTQLYCNLNHIKIENFIRKIGQYVSHIHLSDTKGTNGEGLQFSEGNSDILSILTSLNKYCSTASFIPEVWQGHKENGKGFAKAFSFISKLDIEF